VEIIVDERINEDVEDKMFEDGTQHGSFPFGEGEGG
jgi:hypothetical protein